jgi:hypothetical protein
MQRKRVSVRDDFPSNFPGSYLDAVCQRKISMLSPERGRAYRVSTC